MSSMAPFLYPRKEQRRLPRSQAFETSTLVPSSCADYHRDMASEADQHTHAGAQDLDTYTLTMRRWTLCQLRASVAIPPYDTRGRHNSYNSPSTHDKDTTPTIVSPLYPTNSSLYGCSVQTPVSVSGLARVEDCDRCEDAEELGDVGTTPCNTPRRRGLRRRSTVAAEAAARKKARDEVRDEGEGQARLRPVELVRSLSCVA